jgi:iron(III) transport system permease protein
VAALSAVSLENYASVLSAPTLLGSAVNSFIVAVAAAIGVMGLTSAAAWIITRAKSRAVSLLDVLMTAPLVIPGIVMGLALLQASLSAPIPLFGTLWLMIIAYVASYLPYGMRYATPGVAQLHSELEDSAYTSGATELKTLRKVILPLMRPAIFGGALFVFMAAFRELPRALLLQGLETKTISVKLFDLWSDGQLGELGAFGLMFAMSLGLVGVLARRAFGHSNV